MKRYYLFVIILVASMLIFQFVYAQPDDEGNPPPMNRMGKMLNLTDEQQSQIEDLRLNFEKEKLPLQSKIHELRTGLKLELTKDNYDEKKVNQMLDQIESVRKELHKKRINHMRSVRNILNDDQKKKFDMHILSNRKLGHGRQMPQDMPRHQMKRGPEFRNQ
jgi:Spy/CpxP family protein refolding chaperone